MIYVLIHAYTDRSATRVCGATTLVEVAKAWYAGNDENDVVEFGEHADVVPKELAPPGWREQKKVGPKEMAPMAGSRG